MTTRIALAIMLSVILAGCSSVAALRSLGRLDVERALAIAEYHNDPAGVACATAILTTLLAEPSEPAPVPSGVFSTFMEVRELRRARARGLSETVHNACAPLVLDAQVTLARFGLMFVPGGGVLRGVLR